MGKFAQALSLIILVALLSGCNSVYAAVPQPFPSVPANGTVTLEPGRYACPTRLADGVHIIGHGSIVPAEMLADPSWANLAHRDPLPEVRILCPGGLTITANDVHLSGVIFDFEGSGGLTLESTAYGNLSVAITNAETGLTLHSSQGNLFGLTVPKLVIYNTKTGIYLRGDNATAVTWVDFGHVDIVQARDHGIVISQFADTNTFAAVHIHMMDNATGSGVVFNDAGVLGDVDASGNKIGWLGCDGINFSGYCADFRGYTIGNQVTMGFGIMPDTNKIHFDNAFSAAANRVTKMQESPKAP